MEMPQENSNVRLWKYFQGCLHYHFLSLLLSMAWQHVTIWINVFFWNVLHTNETLWRWKKFPLSLASQTCRNFLWGKWFEEDIRVYILDEHYEKFFTDIFKSEDIFFQNNVTSLISFIMFFFESEKEVWMELKFYGCCWKNLKDYYSRKCTLNQSNEKFLNFFCNKLHEKCSNFMM